MFKKIVMSYRWSRIQNAFRKFPGLQNDLLPSGNSGGGRWKMISFCNVEEKIIVYCSTIVY